MSLKLSFVDKLRTNDQLVRDTMTDAVSRYGPIIEGELALIAANHSPQHIAQSACVFGIMSPNADFDFNVAVTQPLRRALLRTTNKYELAAIIRHHFLGLHNQKAGRLLAIQDFLRTVKPADVRREVISGFNGFGPKVTSMTLHLCDPWADAYTLDRHMLRVLCVLAGVRIERHITHAAYREVEQYLLGVHKELFPNLPPFVSQRAIWNLAFGEHKSHLAIFEGVYRER